MACKIQTTETNHYTEKELDQYSIYMDYNRSIIKQHTHLPQKVMNNMLAGKTLHKIDENTWSIENGGYSVELLPFKAWLKQVERDKKLESIGIC